MFVGQGLSLDACRATQAERWAANAAVVAPPAAERPSSVAPPPPAPLARHPVSLFGIAMGAASLFIAAQSAAVAAATTAALCLPEIERAAQPDDPVPRKFPGKKGIMRPNITPFVIVIFSLMDMICPHVEVGDRNSRATAKWKELFERFFHRTDGVGWQFELWEGNDGLKRFKKAVICAVIGYAKAYAENKGASVDVMMQAHLLEVRCAFGIDIISVVSAFVLKPSSPPRVNTQTPPQCVKIALMKQPRLLVHANSTWRLRSGAWVFPFPEDACRHPLWVTSLILFRCRRG
jgi:hypothetical protein